MAKASENSFIVVNGEKMTIKAWKQMVADKQKDRRGKKRFLKNDKPKKVEKKEKEISIVAAEVEKMMKPAYYDHAYRQWGTIANNILQHRKIRPHFVFYRVSVGELERLIEDIEKMAKGNEKAAYQYVEKTAWKLEDIKIHIQNLHIISHIYIAVHCDNRLDSAFEFVCYIVINSIYPENIF